MTSRPGSHAGRLLVVSGPGGVGKGTVVRALRAARPDLEVSVSATTRPPRPREVDGRDYHFLSRDEFARLVDDGGFLEWAEFNGEWYGTPWSSVRGPLAAGRTVVLEIEVQGARQVREAFADAVLVFLTPPDETAIVTLEERLRGRGDGDAAIEQRLEIARWELAQASEFDHVVVNDHVDEAVRRIGRILDRTPA